MATCVQNGSDQPFQKPCVQPELGQPLSQLKPPGSFSDLSGSLKEPGAGCFSTFVAIESEARMEEALPWSLPWNAGGGHGMFLFEGVERC